MVYHRGWTCEAVLAFASAAHRQLFDEEQQMKRFWYLAALLLAVVVIGGPAFAQADSLTSRMSSGTNLSAAATTLGSAGVFSPGGPSTAWMSSDSFYSSSAYLSSWDGSPTAYSSGSQSARGRSTGAGGFDGFAGGYGRAFADTFNNYSFRERFTFDLFTP